MSITPASNTLAQQAAYQNQQQASQAAMGSLANSGSNTAATSQAAAGAAATTASPLSQALTAAAAQSSAGAATTTATTTKAADGTTTTTAQTKPAEDFLPPLLKLPARAHVNDVVSAMHIAAKESPNKTTADTLNKFADDMQSQRNSFMDGIIELLWTSVKARD